MKTSRFDVAMIFILLIWAMAQSSLQAQPSQVIGSWSPTQGYLTGVDVVNDRAYVTSQGFGLRILDVSDPASPAFLGEIQLSRGAHDVRVSGSYAYVLGGTEGRVTTVDVSDPTKPVQVGYFGPSNALDLQIVGPLMYIAGGAKGLQAYDISNPLVPVLWSSNSIPIYVSSVKVAGSVAWVASDLLGVQMIDISQRPFRRIGLVNPGLYANSLDVVGHYALVADERQGLVVLDIATPSNPVQVGAVLGKGMTHVRVDGHLAYVADTLGELRMLDVSDPIHPACVDGILARGNINGFDLNNGFAYLALGSQGLSIHLARPYQDIPLIHTQSDNKTIGAGASTTFEVKAFPCPESYTYQWQFLGVEIAGATNSVLTVSNVTARDAGDYRVTITGASGSATTHFTLQVMYQPPMVSTRFSGSEPTSATVNAGSEVRIFANVSGAPPPTLQWQCNGRNLTGETGSTLFLLDVDLQHAGIYSVIASNIMGTFTSGGVSLTVNRTAPQFVLDPEPQTTIEGDTAEFSIPEAWGAPPPDYFLLFNGKYRPVPPVHEASSGRVRFAIPCVTLADAGRYSIVCSNAAGEVRTEAATLTITRAASLDRWTRRNPWPVSGKLWSIAQGPDLIVAVGDEGAILTSTDGTEWVAQRPFVDVTLRSVVWGQDQFVIVGDGGLILISHNGVEWTALSSRHPDKLNAVIFEEGQFMAVGEAIPPQDAIVLTSQDGLVWKRQSLVQLSATDVVRGNGTFIVVGYGIYSSTDGRNWRIRESNNAFQAVTFGGGRFIAVGHTGRWATSIDGKEWVEENFGSSESMRGVVYHKDRFIAVGDNGRVRTSPTGQTWTTQSSGVAESLEAILSTDSGLIAVGDYGAIYTSPDGVAWVSRSRITTRDLEGSECAQDTMVIVGKGGVILTSTEGAQYQARVSGTTEDLHDVTWGNNQWIAVGSRGLILTSPDASQWTVRSSGFDIYLKRVLYANGIWIVVGKAGAILTSTDGMAWTRRTANTSYDLNDVAYGQGRFVIAGGGPTPRTGGLLTSVNGITWTSVNRGGGQTLNSVTFADNLFLVTGNNGQVLVSSDGLQWTTRSSGLSDNTDSLRGAAWAHGLWTVVGNHGIVLTSPDTILWTLQRPNTRFYLQDIAEINGRLVAMGQGGTILQSARFHAPQPGGHSAQLALWYELLELRNESTRDQDMRRLDDALDHWQRALAPALWNDDTTLNSRTGAQVFLELKHAIHALDEVQADKQSLVPRSDVEFLLEFLLASARLLAVEELNTSVASGAGAKRVEQALEALRRGDDHADQQQAGSALDQYRQAWQVGGRLQGRLVIRAVSGGLAIEYLGQPDQDCVLESSMDMHSWKPIGKARAEADGTARFIEPMVRGPIPCFYRVRLAH